MAMRYFEITAAGFDGGTDLTDERVLWVKAEEQVIKALPIEQYGAQVVDMGVENNFKPLVDRAVDYTLPGDAEPLEACLRRHAVAEGVVGSFSRRPRFCARCTDLH